MLLNLKLRKKKAYTFIITTMIIISLISILLITSNTILTTNNNNQDIINKLNKNYILEFNNFINNNNNININNINIFNSSLENYIESHNYDTEICSIIDDDNSIYISNYLDKDCDLYIASEYNQTIEAKNTIKIDKFLNPTNIYLCSCLYINKDIYYIKTQNIENVIINKN
jgi:phosphopantetheine adenylyltransferase